MAVRFSTVLMRPAPLEADSVTYDGLARSLLGGPGYTSSSGARALMPPGYPLLLAAVYAAVRPDPEAAYLFQAILATITVMLVMVLASICFGPRNALLSGLFASLYPSFYWLPRRLLSENLALPLTLCALSAAGVMMTRRSFVWAALTGLSLGLGLLVRGSGVFLSVVLLLGLLVSRHESDLGPKRIGLAAVVGITCLLTIAPWLARNAKLLGEPVLSSHAGITLYSSYWPPLKEGKRIWGNVATVEDPEVRHAYELGDEAAASRQLTSITLRRLWERPTYFVALLPEKLANLVVPLDWEILPPRPGSSSTVNVVYALLLVPGALGAWRLLRAPTPSSWLLWVPSVAALAQAAIFYGSPRFRLLADPSLLILAALGILGGTIREPARCDQGGRDVTS